MPFDAPASVVFFLNILYAFIFRLIFIRLFFHQIQIANLQLREKWKTDRETKKIYRRLIADELFPPFKVGAKFCIQKTTNI